MGPPIFSSMYDVHNAAVRELSRLLTDLNVIKSDNLEFVYCPSLTHSTVVEQKLYFKYFPHFVGE